VTAQRGRRSRDVAYDPIALPSILRLAIAVALLCACGKEGRRHPDPAADSILAARKHAGPDAVDCGRASSFAGSGLDACMADALVAHRAFFGVLDERGIDSAVGRAYARSASGDVRQFRFDSDPSGGGGATPSLYVYRCPDPHVEGVGVDRRIHCADDGRRDAADLRSNAPSQAVYK
jgi:hypothetical protein